MVRGERGLYINGGIKMEYQTIKADKTKKDLCGFIGRYFKPEESDGLIKGLVTRIEEFGKARGVETNCSVGAPEGYARLTQVEIRSRDGVIDGVIRYRLLGGEGTDIVDLALNFKSKSESDREEYGNLVKIVRDAGFKIR